MSEYDTADIKNLHYHAFNYRNAHSTQAGNDFNTLEEFVSKMCIAAGDRWREEWSEACNDNQILSNTCDESLAFIKELTKERNTALARLAAIEAQEPVGYVHSCGDLTLSIIREKGYYKDQEMSLFAAAGASPQPAQPSPAHLEVLRRVAHELRFYNPAADEYKGKHVHKYWSDEITKAIAQIEALGIAAINAKEPK